MVCCCLVWLAGCTAAPQEQLGIARHLVARAYHMDAPQLEPVEYRKAQLDLQAGEQAMTRKDYAEADRLLRKASEQALAVLQSVQQKQVRLGRLQENDREELWSRYSPDLKAQNRLKLPTEEELPPPTTLPSAPAPAPAPAPAAPQGTNKDRTAVRKIDQVTVKKGETLFSIAAEPAVLGDPLLWPLLYQANRDQIKDPRQIYPGQVLAIPRNVSAADMERARTTARESNVFPLN